MNIIKRDGTIQPFDGQKIMDAILKAFIEVDGAASDYACAKAYNIAMFIENKNEEQGPLTIKEIQDLVQKGLMATKRKDVAMAYIEYRMKRDYARENTIEQSVTEIVGGVNDYCNQENSNKNAALATTQRDYIAGEVSIDMSERRLLPPDIVEAHKQGIIHFHDMDYFLQTIHNCCLINLEDMLQNGTVINGKYIDKPHTFSTACTIATQIIAQVASSQYGGQSFSLAHLAPFIEETRKTFKRRYPELSDELIEKMVNQDIEDGIQTIQYQVETLMTTNGQAPFVTLYMNINETDDPVVKADLAKAIAEVLKQRYEGIKNEQGVRISPAFPKLIYALDDNNIHPESEYYYLTELAAKCSAKRLVPDYISNKIQRQLKNGDTYPCMGCRSFLTSDTVGMDNGKHKYYGRFNQGVVTINLVDVACSADNDFNKFWQIFDERLELCHRALQCRHNRLKGTKSDIAPILWQYGAIARLKPGETIDELLKHNYSTISLGYAGLYECVYKMLGCSHTDEKGKEFAIQIMQKMNDKCNEWKAAEDIAYSLYGTPLESTTYKFAKCLQKRFGIIHNVTDHDYITNSYHVNVREKIDAFTKLKFEAPFQELSPGGAISYVEVPNLQDNLDAVMSLITYIYDNILYAELNTKSDYCQVCGFDGEIKTYKDEKTGRLGWKCPQCGNTDQSKMNVIRRTCGYLGSNYWNQGRTQEISERVLHL